MARKDRCTIAWPSMIINKGFSGTVSKRGIAADSWGITGTSAFGFEARLTGRPRQRRGHGLHFLHYTTALRSTICRDNKRS